MRCCILQVRNNEVELNCDRSAVGNVIRHHVLSQLLLGRRYILSHPGGPPRVQHGMPHPPALISQLFISDPKGALLLSDPKGRRLVRSPRQSHCTTRNPTNTVHELAL